MAMERIFRWFAPRKNQPYRKNNTLKPNLQCLERKEVPAGYLALGAGPGSLAAVAIRVDIQDQIGGSGPNGLGQPPAPRSDGKTDATTQVFYPFGTGFRGGVHTATGNFDGVYGTPDQLVTAAGPGGGPHVIIWNMVQNADGRIVTNGIRDQFFAFDTRFRGGVNVAAGDLDGDGRAELICGAGAGGGPHVRIYKDVGGRFQMVNEFFAFATNFRGGVSVASSQGYNTTQQLRLVLDRIVGDDGPAQVTPYLDIPNQNPSLTNGTVLMGRDYPVGAGGTEPFANNYGATGLPRTVPNGIEGHLNDENRPYTYFTIAAGHDQYLSGNLINTLGNIFYRPVIRVSPPNDDGIGEYVTAKWSNMSKTLPNLPGFTTDIEYGPFVRVAKTADGVDVITRLTRAPDQVTFRNQLVIGAGPGGGPHVKVFEFAGNAAGQLINNGVSKEFFAFDASFRGGVNVSVANALEHQEASSKLPARIDYTQDPPALVIDTSENSGTQVFSTIPVDTELFRRDQPEIICGMATGGSEVRIWADVSPKTNDPTNPFSDNAPARRTSIGALNLQPFRVDLTHGVDPGSPLQGYYGFTTVTSFKRTFGASANYTGGISVAAGALAFVGSSDTRFYGTGTISAGVPFGLNPALSQTIIGANAVVPGQVSYGSRVQIYNQMSPLTPTDNNYPAFDDFQAFPAIPAQGVSVAFGFGVLAEPDLDVNYAPRTVAANGIVNSTGLTLYTADTSTDPILI